VSGFLRWHRIWELWRPLNPRKKKNQAHLKNLALDYRCEKEEEEEEEEENIRQWTIPAHL
jgi:hypothetical protein